MEGKVGVASGGGMRLKARLSRPPAAGTYPPAPTSHDRGKPSRAEDRRGLWSWRRVIVAERGGREYHARASNEYMVAAGGIGGGYEIRADYEKIIHANY